MTRKSVGFGLTDPGPVASGVPSGDVLRTQLAMAVKDQRDINMARALGAIPNPGSGHAEPPPATSLTEQTKAMTDMVKVTTDLHKDVAETHRQEAKDAREEARLAKEEAETKAVQAVEATEKQAVSMMDMLKQSYEAQIAYINADHEKESKINDRINELESKLAVAQLEGVKAELKAEIQQMKDSFQHELEKKDEKIAKLEQERAYFANRETVDDVLVHYLKTGEVPQVFTALTKLTSPVALDDEDPTRLANKILAKGWAESEVEKSKAEVTRAKNEVANADEMQKLLRGLVGQGMGFLGTLKAHVPLLFGQPPLEYEQFESPPVPPPAEDEAEEE